MAPISLGKLRGDTSPSCPSLKPVLGRFTVCIVRRSFWNEKWHNVRQHTHLSSHSPPIQVLWNAENASPPSSRLHFMRQQHNGWKKYCRARHVCCHLTLHSWLDFRISLASFVKIVFIYQLRPACISQKYAICAQISPNLPRMDWSLMLWFC